MKIVAICQRLAALALMTLVAHGVIAQAPPASLTVTPSSANLVVGANTPVNLNWAFFTGANDGTLTMSSASGQLLANTGNGLTPIATINTAISIVNVNVSTLYNRAELLQVPTSVLANAWQNGVTTLVYRRTFSGSFDGPQTAQVTLNLSSNPATAPGALDIQRLQLSFDNRELTRQVSRGAPLTAIADLNYSGSGVLDAQWEVATPPSTQGQPLWQPLSSLRQFLGAGGYAVLESPALPTDVTGIYLVRLRIINPTGVETIQLTYRVVDEGAGAALPAPAPLRALAPAADALLVPDTEFRWQAIPGAIAYQLEIYPGNTGAPVARSPEASAKERIDPQQRPDTGMLVPGTDTSLQLTSLSREHLQSGRKYQWRVIAIANNGRILATSPLRTVVMP